MDDEHRDLPEALARDWRTADVPDPYRRLLAYAEKLTLRPSEMEEADLGPLREAGWSDEAVLHVCEIVAYYNFVNRMAEGLGISLEPWRSEAPVPYDGEEPGPGPAEGGEAS